MKFVKLLPLYVSLCVILNSCTTFSEVGKTLRNEKVDSSDEFFIKKREPLTQPPDYDKIPKPGSIEGNKNSDKKNIEKILKTNQTKSSGNQTKSSSSAEEFILKKIKK